MAPESTPGGRDARPLVLVVGAASRDVADGDPRGWRLGGAVIYGGLTLARLGLQVRAVVGVDAEAASATELELLARAGARVQRLPLAAGPVFDNVATPAGRRQRSLSAASVMPLAGLGEVPPNLAAVLFVPVAGELGDEWAGTAPDDAVVGLGLQGLLRELRPGAEVRARRPGPSTLLARADIVGLSTEDLGDRASLEDVLALAAPGATVLLTRGGAGGVAVTVPTDPGAVPVTRRYRAVASDGVMDPTGAGDVFLAALLACRLEPSLAAAAGGGAVARALRFAAAAASMAVEAPGVTGVPTLDDVRRRLQRTRSRAIRCTTAPSRRGSGRPSQA